MTFDNERDALAQIYWELVNQSQLLREILNHLQTHQPAAPIAEQKDIVAAMTDALAVVEAAREVNVCAICRLKFRGTLPLIDGVRNCGRHGSKQAEAQP